MLDCMQQAHSHNKMRMYGERTQMRTRVNQALHRKTLPAQAETQIVELEGRCAALEAAAAEARAARGDLEAALAASRADAADTIAALRAAAQSDATQAAELAQQRCAGHWLPRLRATLLWCAGRPLTP